MKNVNQELLNHVILHKDRIPHFHKDFPLILFWSHRSGCTTLANWFFFKSDCLMKQRNTMTLFITMNSGCIKQHQLHTRVTKWASNSRKAVCKLVRNPYTRAVSSFYYLLTIHMQFLNGKVSASIYIMTNIVTEEYHLNNFYITFEH